MGRLLAIALLLAAAQPTPAIPAVEGSDRLLAGGAAALGAVVGAVLGSSTALALGASLAGINDAARAVPELAFPPACAAIGAGAAGAVAGGAGPAWAGGVGALAGAGIASLGIALAWPAVSLQDQDVRFALVVLAPAALAAFGAGAGAALFASSGDEQ